jgi:LacI family transcriptional regulator
MANIKDVAKKAGVSTSTVSHFINKTRFVSDPLKKKIEEVMDELDYYPNLIAGSLRRKKTRTIGFVMPDSSNLLFTELVKKVEDIFNINGYNVIICNSSYNNLDKEISNIKTLRSKRVDGILIETVTSKGAHLEQLIKDGISVVVLDCKLPDINLDTIIVNNVKGTFQAAEHLIKLGHKRIAYIDRNIDNSYSLDRKAGYLKALETYGIVLQKQYMVRAKTNYFDGGISAANEILDLNPRPTAVIAFSDVIAIGAIRGFADRKIRIPESISIIGCDDVYISNFTVPRLTTIHYPIKELAELSSKRLLTIMNSETAEKPKKTLLEPNLVIRETTASPKS